MYPKARKDQEPWTYQALLTENQVLSDENHTLKEELQSLRVRLQEAEEYKSHLLKVDKERECIEEVLAVERSQLLSIFDSIDDAVHVTDLYTNEVLYANRTMKEKLGAEPVGGICYKEFQQRDSPCNF